MQTMTVQNRCAEAGRLTVDAHLERCGYEIGDVEYGIVMTLVDLVAYARTNRIDFEAAVQGAYETLGDITQ